jgi:hypothetical protein
MVKKITEKIEEELKELKTEIEFSGVDVHIACKTLEKVMRDLKVFDQKRHKADQLDSDINRRFEAIVLCLEKITKILKENELI